MSTPAQQAKYRAKLTARIKALRETRARQADQPKLCGFSTVDILTGLESDPCGAPAKWTGGRMRFAEHWPKVVE